MEIINHTIPLPVLYNIKIQGINVSRAQFPKETFSATRERSSDKSNKERKMEGEQRKKEALSESVVYDEWTKYVSYVILLHVVL